MEEHIKKYHVNDIEILYHIVRINTKKKYVQRDKYVFKLLRQRLNMNTYITCEEAIKIAQIANIDLKKFPYFHSICPFIIDWWNIWSDYFDGAALCYYADFGDYHPKYGSLKIKNPRLPNKCCEKTYENNYI